MSDNMKRKRNISYMIKISSTLLKCNFVKASDRPKFRNIYKITDL